MAKDDPSVGTGVNNPGALNDFYDDIDGMTGAQATRVMAGRTISNIIQDAPQRDTYVPGERQSDMVIDARENSLELLTARLQGGFRGIYTGNRGPGSGIERYDRNNPIMPDILLPTEAIQDEIRDLERLIDRIDYPADTTPMPYSAFLQDQDTVTNPPTLGPARASGAYQGRPFGQADVLPAIANAALEPYHAFLRAWEAMSQPGGEASVSDVLQVAIPAALPGARLPRNTMERHWEDTHPTIMGGHPDALYGSRDLRIENFPAMNTADDIVGRARVEHGPIDAANMTPDEFSAAMKLRTEALWDDMNRTTGMSEEEIKYARAVRQQEQGQQTGPSLRVVEELEATPDEAANILRRARTTGVLDEAPSGTVRLPSADAANQTDLRIIGDAMNRAGVDMDTVRVRHSNPDPTTGEVSTYISFPDAQGKMVKLRVSNHEGHARRNELNTRDMSPAEIETEIQRRMVDPDTTKGAYARHPLLNDQGVRDIAYRLEDSGMPRAEIARQLNELFPNTRRFTGSTVHNIMNTRPPRQSEFRNDNPGSQTRFPSRETLNETDWIHRKE